MKKTITLALILTIFFTGTSKAQNLRKIDSLQTLLQKSEKQNKVNLLNKLGWEYRNADFTKAFTYLQESIALAEKINDVTGLADAYSFTGIVYKYTGDYQQALDYFYKALHHGEKHQLTESIGYSYNNICEIQRYQKNFKEALMSSDQAIAEFTKIKSSKGLGYAYIRRGEIFQDQKNYQAAIEAFVKSLVIRQEMKDLESVATSLNRIGLIHNLWGKNQEALEYLNKALKIAEELHDRRGIINFNIDISKVYLDEQNYAKAKASAMRSITEAQKMKSVEYIKEASKVLFECYAKEGDYVMAYKYQHLHLMMKDSLMNGNIEKELSKMQANYIIEKKQAEVDLLNKDKIIQKEEIENQRLFLMLVSLGLLSLLGLASTLVYINYKRRKTNLSLQEKSKIIQQKSEEIEAQNENLMILNADITQKNEEIESQRDNLILLNADISQKNEEIEAQRDNLLDLTQNLEKEKNQSDKLLLNILPFETAQELKEKGIATPKRYAQVTVLFTDFKGFTFHAEKLSPEQLVEELNFYFSAFDGICQRYNLEKIKTIGDAYMAAGGIPTPNQSNPIDAVKAGLEMQKFMEEYNAKLRLQGGECLSLRIGIHTGPVVAGVIGLNKFAYDIWGDAVNLASRMESSGEVGRVNISGSTYQLVKHHFACSYRGKISAKNKGEVDMYFVDEGIQPGVQAYAPDFYVNMAQRAQTENGRSFRS
jgi:adenylate cyclase